MTAPRLAAAVLALVVPAAVWAQEQPPAADTAPAPLMTAPRPDDRAATPPAPPALDPLSAEPAEATLPPVTVEDARRLVGRTVLTQDGKAQATIHDIAQQEDRVTGLMLSTDGGRVVTVPPEVLRVGSDGSLTIAMSAEALAAVR